MVPVAKLARPNDTDVSSIPSTGDSVAATAMQPARSGAVPQQNATVVSAERAFTVPCRVAAVSPTPVAASVVTVGTSATWMATVVDALVAGVG
ncbi:unannotated protein [freshwater metagenome]|uniref:Unannotated protein n=1 Tax=freshwater metagenome TaxID=449393 RepID=A0A6J6Z278_9ZZZZ